MIQAFKSTETENNGKKRWKWSSVETKKCKKFIPGRLDSTQLDALIIACGILKNKNKTLLTITNNYISYANARYHI